MDEQGTCTGSESYLKAPIEKPSRSCCLRYSTTRVDAESNMQIPGLIGTGARGLRSSQEPLRAQPPIVTSQLSPNWLPSASPIASELELLPRNGAHLATVSQAWQIVLQAPFQRLVRRILASCLARLGVCATRHWLDGSIACPGSPAANVAGLLGDERLGC
jgi:hypothetical protein